MVIELRPFQFANFSRSTLAGDISAAATELSVQEGDGALFPALDYSYEQICSLIAFSSEGFEVMYATARDGDTFTVERGKEGTTALAFAAGDTIVHSVTKGFLEFVRAANVSTPSSAVALEGGQVGDDFVLTWTAGTFTGDDSLDRYDIYRNVDSGAFSKIGESTALTFTDTTVDLASGATYGYYVVPVGTLSGAGAQSNTIFNSADVMYALGATGELAASFDGKAFTIVAEHPASAPAARKFDYQRSTGVFVIGCDNDTIVVSDDFGATWSTVTVGWDTSLNDTQDIASNDDIIVAGSGDYIYDAIAWSEDGGATWTRGDVYDTDGVTKTRFRVLRLWWIPEVEAFFGGYYNQDNPTANLIRSTDGKTFQAVRADPSGSTTFSYTYCIAYDAGNSRLVLMQTGGVYYSTDGGLTWTLIDTPSNLGIVSPSQQSTLVYDSIHNQLVYGASNGTIWYSTDGGATWTGGTDYGTAIYQIALSESLGTVVAVGGQGLYTDDGSTWYGNGIPMGAFEDTNWYDILVAPRPVPANEIAISMSGATDEPTVATTSWGGITTYQVNQRFLSNTDIMRMGSIAYDATAERLVVLKDSTFAVAGSPATGGMYSDDKGATWTFVTGLPVGYDWRRVVYVHQLGYWYATRESVGASETDSIYRSSDGITWSALDMGTASIDVSDIVYAPAFNGGAGRLVACGVLGGSNSIYYSDDGGDTWTVTPWLASAAAGGITYDSVNERVIACAAATGRTEYSSDAVTWNISTTSPGGGAGCIVFIPWANSGGGAVVVGRSGSIEVSLDGGDNFTSYTLTGLSQIECVVHDGVSRVAVGATSGEIVLITDFSDILGSFTLGGFLNNPSQITGMAPYIEGGGII